MNLATSSLVHCIAFVALFPNASNAMERVAIFKEELTLSQEDIRPEFTQSGENWLIDIHTLCQKIGCEVKVEQKRYWNIKKRERGFTWDKKYPQVAKSIGNEHAYEVQLPVSAILQGDTLLFPIRILTETLGYNTLYHPEDRKVSIYLLSEKEKKVPIELKKKIAGSNSSVSYFIDAIEYDDSIYLTFDYSNRLYRFDKKNKLQSHFYEIDSKKYGIIRKFEDLGQKRIVALSEKGHLFLLKDEKLTHIGGGGSRILDRPGQKENLKNVRFKSLTFISKATKGEGYLLDTSDQKLYKIDKNLKHITYVYNTKKWNWILDLVTAGKDPVILSFKDKQTSIIKLQSDRNYKPVYSPCTQKIFKDKRLYGGLPLKKEGQWIFLDSASRNIVLTSFSFKSLKDKSCKILERTFTGNQTAFLNNFGQSFTRENQHIIIDSDGFNIVKYDSNKSITLISKDDLFKNTKQKWIAPVSLAQMNSDLYVLGNLSHQVYRLNSKDKLQKGSVYLGTGQPVRKNEPHALRTKTTIGYSGYITGYNNKLWVADHFGRRVLYTIEDRSFQLFPPTAHTYMAGLSGLTFLNGYVYMTDPILGVVFRFPLPKKDITTFPLIEKIIYKTLSFLGVNKPKRNPNAPLPIAGNLSKKALKDSEVFRRNISKKSILKMDTFKSVEFGFPQSIVQSANKKLLVSDIYRHGIWELDPQTESVKALAGFKTPANYHFGSVNGNIGFPGRFIRLNSPGILEYNSKYQINIIPSVYGEKIILANKDFSKTCYADTDIKFKAPFQAILLEDKTLAVADSATHDVYLFKITDDSCLKEKLDFQLFDKAL